MLWSISPICTHKKSFHLSSGVLYFLISIKIRMLSSAIFISNNRKVFYGWNIKWKLVINYIWIVSQDQIMTNYLVFDFFFISNKVTLSKYISDVKKSHAYTTLWYRYCERNYTISWKCELKYVQYKKFSLK